MARAPRTKKARGAPAGMSLGNKLGVALVAVFFVAMLYELFSGHVRSSGRRSFQAAPEQGTASRVEREGKPWEYDAANDRYFDPRPGHHHWHPGHPPDVDQRSAPAPAD